jgi:hypothetical protein
MNALARHSAPINGVTALRSILDENDRVLDELVAPRQLGRL